MWRFKIIFFIVMYFIFLAGAISDNYHDIASHFDNAVVGGTVSYIQLGLVIAVLAYAAYNHSGKKRRNIIGAIALVVTTAVTALAGRVGLFVMPAFFMLLTWMYHSGYII